MKAKRLLLALTVVCTVTCLHSQNLYDASGGTVIGRIQNGCIYDASGGTTIGQIRGERITDGSGGQTLNQLRSNGQVMDASGGYTVGVIKSNGQVTDGSGGRTLGYVENGNVYDSSHGKRIGNYKGVDAKLAAYYFFFFPNKGATTTAKPSSKPAAKPQITDALAAPRENTLLFLNRSHQKIGTLYGDNRYVSNSGVEFLFKKTAEGMIITRNGVYDYEADLQGNVYYKQDEEKILFCHIDEQGNAFAPNGDQMVQYGKIADDGTFYATTSLDYPFGYVAGLAEKKRTAAFVYFVLLYNNLIHSYLKADKEKENGQQP